MERKPSSINNSKTAVCNNNGTKEFFGLQKAQQFLADQISAKEYITSHFDRRGSNTYNWDELLCLQENMEVFSQFLLKFNKIQRRQVLLNEEIIGFTETNLYDFYGITSDQVGKFIGRTQKKKTRVKVPPKIRKIITNKIPDIEFVSFFALLSRVPLSWLCDDNPKLEWTTDYFQFLPEVNVCGEEFLKYIHSLSMNSLSRDLHDLRGFILDLEGDVIDIRFEWIYGGFIIEIFNSDATPSKFDKIKKLLSSFELEIGYTKTVIPSQHNFTFICNHQSLKPIIPKRPLYYF
jgi:hypothetical protein